MLYFQLPVESTFLAKTNKQTIYMYVCKEQGREGESKHGKTVTTGQFRNE